MATCTYVKACQSPTCQDRVAVGERIVAEGTDATFRRHLARILDPTKTMWVAYLDDEAGDDEARDDIVVAYAVIREGPCCAAGPKASILFFEVFMDFRGLSYGTQFCDFLKGHYESEGFSALEATSVVPSSKGFWAKMGFEERKARLFPNDVPCAVCTLSR